MYATPKAQVAPRLAAKIIKICVWKLPFVAIARPIGEANEVACFHLLTVQLEIFLQTATETLGRGIKSQRFLNGVGQ